MDELPARRLVARVLGTGPQAVARSLFDVEDEVPHQVPLGPAAPPPDSVIELQVPPAGGPAGPDRWRLLAEPATARAALYQILRRHRVNPLFPSQVEVEVAAILRDPGINDPRLVDLSGLPFVTVDNPDSRDLDQALHIARDGDGYMVHYALADAAHYVRPGSALFDEALARGVSYYLPGLSVPMLPPELSEGLVSLNPQVRRRAVVFVIALDGEGRRRHTELVRARILSRAQLTYAGVQRYLDDPASSPLQGRDFCASLQLLREVGLRRLALARERDAVQFSRDDVSVTLSVDGARFTVVHEQRNDVSMYNEQISLLCNMEGARFLSSGPHEVDVQGVYRVHDPPDGNSLRALAHVIDHIVQAHGLDAELWRWRPRGNGNGDGPGTSLASYLDRLPREAATERVRQAIERQVLLVNRRSSYGAEPGRHFALGVDPYSRFSSPMREVVGVFTHKEALEKLGLVLPGRSTDGDKALRNLVIASANRSKDKQSQLESEVMKLAVDELLRGDLQHPLDRRPERQGTLLGLKATRLYVRLDEPPVELKIYLPQLAEALGIPLDVPAGDVALCSGERTLLRVGDAVTLRSIWYDEDRGRWHLVPLGLG